MEELKVIVQRMIDAGEPEDKIREAVRIYKERNLGKEQGSTVDPTMSQDIMGSQLGDGSSELPEDKGWFEDMWTAIKGGSAAGSSVGEAFDVYRQGRNISDEDLQKYIEAAKLVEQNPETNEAASWKRDMKKHGGGFLGGFMGLLENPGYFPQFVASSAATMATSFFDSPETAAAAGVGAGTGAALGSAATPIGTATGAVGGAMAGLVGAMETGLTLTDLLRDELGEKDFNKENIRALLEDKDVMERVKSKALARGATIGAVEGLTLGFSRGVGSKIIASAVTKGAVGLSKAGLKTGAKVAATTTGIEMAGGGVGETLGTLAADQELKGEEIFLEMIGEGKGIINTSDMVKAAVSKTSYKVNGEETTAKKIKRIIDSPNTSKADLAEMNIEITGDKAFESYVKTKQNDAVLETQIDERVEGSDRKKLVELEKKRRKAEADTKKKGIFKVINADTKLENIESEIAEIIGRYEAVDVTDAEVQARKKVAEEVRAGVAERDFQANLAFAKKHSKLYGLEVDDTMTIDQIKKKYGEEAATADGFIIDDKIIINKAVAKLTGAVNVGNHELLHGILRKAVKEGKINKNLISDLKTKFGENNWSKVEQRIKDAGYTQKYMNENQDEYITLLSDAIANNDITFDEGLFTPIKELLLPIFRAFGFKKINFETADSTYEFLKEYNKSIHKGALSSAIVKATEGKVDVEGMKMSRSKLIDTINDLQQGATTKADFQKPETFNKVFEAVQPGGAINNYIRSLQMSPEKTQETIDAVTDRLINFDPAAKRKDGTVIGPRGLGEFIMANVGFGKLVAAKKLAVKGEKAKRETSIDTEEAMQVADKPTTKKAEPKDQKRREIQSLSRVYGVANEVTLNNKIQALIEKNPKNLESEIRSLIEKDIRKAITKQMGKISKKKGEVVISDEWKSFLALNYENIVQGLDVATIKKNYNQLFELTEIGKEDRKTRKADKPSLKKDSNYRKSIFKIETNKAKFTKFFTEGGYTTLLDRQKKLAILIGESIVENIVNNEIIENSNDNNAVINAKLKDYANKINRQKKEVLGNYNDQIKFSKSKAAKDVNDGIFLSDQIVKNGGIEGIYKKGVFPPRLIKNPRKISYEMQEFVFNEIYADGNLAQFSAKELAAISTAKILQKVGRTYANTNNGAIYEQFVIDVAKNIPGITVLSETMAEGGIPDLHVQLHGKDFFVEVKMANAQYSSITISEYDIAKNKWKIKKEYDFNDQINALVKKASKGVKAAQKYINDQKIPDPKTGEPFVWKMFGQPIPTVAIQMLKDAGLYNGMMAMDSFDINNIGEMYRGKEYPVHYIHIQGKGLFHMGKNPLGLPVPQLTGDATITLRRVPSTQYRVAKESDNLKGGIFNKDGSKKNVRTGYTTLTYRAIPQIDAKSVPKSNHSIGNILEFNELVETKEVQALKMSKSAKNAQTLNNAVKMSRSTDKPSKGITVLDFDDTLATTKSLVKFTRPDGTTGTLNAEEYASTYEDLLDKGYTFDFSDFNKVVKGKLAPLFQKALKLQKKFGPENMFVLTARPPAAQKPIFDFLKANGLNIPIKNITGLANSTSEAKALWIADKVGEGYNDFYFADDALQNVQAVKNMLDQFDVKSKVQQAKVKFSKSINDDFNNILEDVTGIESKKRFSAIKARKRGESKGKFRFFIPPSHEDFVGLLYNFMGKGKEGNAHRDFFEKALIKPLNRAYRELNAAKQSIANDYKNLAKRFPKAAKALLKKTPDGDFTYQDAVRVYLWDKHGYTIPGLSPTDQIKLVELVNSMPNLRSYAENINIISKQDKYVAPSETWEAGDIRTDLDDATGRIGREEFFAEFLENADIIFSQENLNKIEAAYGADVVSAIKDMLYRIRTGQNRPSGQNALVNKFLNYLNGSVASTMFFNIRSAVLQQMSMVNFINFADNNIIAAAKAFANQKQYWADWATIFNSDFMKQRRKGIQTDVNGAELAASVKNAKNPIQAAIKKLLELGFLPTQIGDNIAIATGGATFLRNRINTYLKEGMTKKEAEAKAWTDFEILAEATQQSARPDMVSQQQASPLGKVILAFQNVTSQFNRLGKKAFLDIKNRRITPGNTTQLQSDMSNLSRIAYYFAIQNLIFYSLQSALFMMMFDDNEDDEKFLKKKERMINGSIDSVLRGTGVWGAAIATLKNMAIKWHEQRDKGYNADESAVLMEMLNVSPPLGIKARKLVNAEKTLNYNKKTIEEMETFDIDNPQWSAYTNYIESTTNVPLNRLYNKTQNVREALNNQHSAFERVLLFSGWSKWNLGIQDVEKEKKKQEFGGRKKTRTRSRTRTRTRAK